MRYLGGALLLVLAVVAVAQDPTWDLPVHQPSGIDWAKVGWEPWGTPLGEGGRLDVYGITAHSNKLDVIVLEYGPTHKLYFIDYVDYIWDEVNMALINQTNDLEGTARIIVKTKILEILSQ